MKKYFSLIISIFFLCISIVSAEDFDITGQNVILYNLNDQSVLYEQNANQKTPIASLTKIMTALVSIENIDNLDSLVTITNDDFADIDGYSKAGFKVGEQVTYRDLLYATLLPSGAEAVNALVNNTLGYDDFIKAMNDKAKEIGLENTSFANPIGKDNELNYSTAKDVSNLLLFALKNDNFKEIFTTKTYTATNGLKLESTLNNYKNFQNINEIEGAKSGFTQGAGRCLASITTLNDVDYLLVVIKSSTDKAYNAVKDTLTIYDYYKDNYSYQLVLSDDKVIETIPVKWSKEKEYNITAPEDIELFLKNDKANNLIYKYDGVDEISNNTLKDTKLGTISIYDNEDLLYKTDVYLETEITYYHPILWITGLIILGLFVVNRVKSKRKRRKKRC